MTAKNLQDPSMIVEFEDSDTLVIAVTGFGNKLMLPTRQFFKRAGLEGHSKIILHDPSMMKFLEGVPGTFTSFDHMIDVVGSKIAACNPARVLVTGTSGGGHTAMLLAHLLKADICTVFAPYPYLSYEKVHALGDPSLESFARLLERFNALTGQARKYLDVADVLSSWNGRTTYFSHVAYDHTWDKARSRSLEGLPGMNVVYHPSIQHSIATHIDRYGLLRWCFDPGQQPLFHWFYHSGMAGFFKYA